MNPAVLFALAYHHVLVRTKLKPPSCNTNVGMPQVPWYCAWIANASFFNFAYEALAVCGQLLIPVIAKLCAGP